MVYVARDELQDCAALLVPPDWLGRRVEAHTVQMCEERVYRGCPGPGSAADGVANFDGGAHVAAEGLFLHADIVSAFSAAAQLAYLLRVRIREGWEIHGVARLALGAFSSVLLATAA